MFLKTDIHWKTLFTSLWRLKKEQTAGNKKKKTCSVYLHLNNCNPQQVKVKWSCHRPGVAQRMGRGIVLLFHDRGTRRGWVVSSTPRPHFTPRKDPVPILKEDGWVPWPVWMGGKSRPHRDSIPDHPAYSQSLYRLSYLAQILSK